MALALLTFMQLYIVFLICDFFCPFFFFPLILFSGIETPDQNGHWYQQLLTWFAIVYKSNTEGTNFPIMFVCFMFMYNVHDL